MNKDRVFWGVCFLLMAVLLITNQICGPFEIGLFQILITLLCIAIIIRSIVSINFFGILLPIAAIYTIYRDFISDHTVFDINTGTIWVAAVLASIGLEILFKDAKKKHYMNFHKSDIFVNGKSENLDGERIYIKNAFHESSKYIKSTNFVEGAFENSFGSVSVYMDRTNIINDSVLIRVSNSFGEMNLYFPASWNVQNNIKITFGEVKEQERNYSVQSPVVNLIGTNTFGEIHIFYM